MSSSYEQFGHLRIPLKEIVSATDNFSDANLIWSDGFWKDYKGQLLRSGQLVDIVARRLEGTYRHGDKEFWTEVSMLSKLEHRNLVSIVGFCDENGKKVVINRHDRTHGNLYQHLKDPSVTWTQRLNICVGVAHALNYIYYDKRRDFSVIHRDINCSKILLDEQWEPKLSGFELSKAHPAARRNFPCHDFICATQGYCDPTYIESGSVTHKSDIYSFGIIFFKVLRGIVFVHAWSSNWNSSFASSARSHYEEGRLEDMINPDLWKQMNTKSFKIFSETAYHCLNKQRP